MTLTDPTPKTPTGWVPKVPPVLTSMDVELVQSLSGEFLEGSRLRFPVGIVLHIHQRPLVRVGHMEDVVTRPPDDFHRPLSRAKGDPDGEWFVPDGRVLRKLDQLDVIRREFVLVEEVLPVFVVWVLAVLQVQK